VPVADGDATGDDMSAVETAVGIGLSAVVGFVVVMGVVALCLVWRTRPWR